MKLALISDYLFLKSGTTWYASIPWDGRFIDTFGGSVDHIVLVGRCREAQHGEVSAMYPVDPAYYSVVPMPYWDGFGFARHLPRILRGLYQVCRECDGLFLKMFYIQSVLAYFVNRLLFRKPVAALLVGDAAAAFTLREDLVSVGPLRRWIAQIVRLITRHILANVDVPATVSMGLRERYAIRPDTIVANESWVDEEHFHYRQQEAPTGSILFVGRLVPLKGLNDLIDALHSLKADGVKFQCTIVGDGPMRGEIENKLLRLDLTAEIKITGWLRSLSDELLAQYRQADVLCLPSYSEGLPLVLIEAMANGVAVVASRVGGIPEIVQHEINGLLVDPGDAGGIASSIRRLLTDHDLWRRCVANGYEIARSNTYRNQRGKLGRAFAELLEASKSKEV